MVDVTVEVQIDEGFYVPLLLATGSGIRTLSLTTREPRQVRAIISVLVSGPGLEHAPLTTFEISDIPAVPARPRIDLRGSIVGRRLVLDVRLNGATYATRTLRLPGPLRLPRRPGRGKQIILAATGAAVVVAVVGTIILLGSRISSGSPAPRTAIAESVDTSGQLGAASKSAHAAAPVAGTAQSVAGTGQTSKIPAEGNTSDRAAAAGNAQSVAGTAQSAAGTAKSASRAPTMTEEHLIIHFLPDDSHLTDGARARLESLVSALRGTRVTDVSIIGYCAIAGSEAGRAWISTERADAVSAYLRNAGIALPQTSTVEGLGASNPVTRLPDMQELNRRVEITIRYESS